MNGQSTQLLVSDTRQSVVRTRGAARSVDISYTSFGAHPAPAQLPVLGFNGQRAEASTGQYPLGHGRRVYNPALMRFHQSDALSPFGQGGLNAYAYCEGDPVNRTDPSGRAAEWMSPTTAIVAIGGNAAVFAAIMLAAVNRKPGTIGMWGTRATLIGAPIGVLGGILRLFGEKKAAPYVALGGSALNGLGSALRFAQAFKTLRANAKPMQAFVEGLQGIVEWKPKKAAKAGAGVPIEVKSSAALSLPNFVPDSPGKTPAAATSAFSGINTTRGRAGSEPYNAALLRGPAGQQELAKHVHSLRNSLF